ncbi:MAG: sulfotransferase domain-containing protein [Deltaproteobacteria bacterium]|nr:sulfotransferase domain-containing protein [Deltaproteobacteria bacterium]
MPEGAPRSILGRLREVLTPLAAGRPGMRGWRFVQLEPASTGLEACFVRDEGPPARLRFTRRGSGPAWRRIGPVDVGLVCPVEGRLPEPGLPQQFLERWLERRLAGAVEPWPRWEPDPAILLLVSGVPRSGTGWVKRIARSLVESAGHFLGGEAGSDDVTLDRPGALADHEAAAAVACDRHRLDPSRVRLVKAHYFSGSADSAAECLRVLFVYRDLRDVMVSQLDHELHRDGGRLAGLSPAEGFARLVGWTLPPAAAALARAAAGVPATTLLLRYEHLLRDLPAETRRIAAHLGIEIGDDFLDFIAAAHSFRRESGRDPGREVGGAYHRRGVAGGWGEHLTAPELEMIEQAVPDLEELLARLDEQVARQRGQGRG